VIYGSVCSGIEAATVAWKTLGWEAEFFSEIEPFPSAVLNHHYPNVPNYGDMTKYKEWENGRSIDVLVGGTPCQSFSVAGLRKGLADPRGNLMLTFGAIAERYRPRWVVFENVPGLLSSNGGRDFAAFLGMLGQLGYGFAYRVLDAQFFGVAQRRRRVFVVGYLGDWRPPAAVLFEPESLRGDSAPSREKGEDTTGSTGDGLARCITTGEAKRQDWETCNIVACSAIGIDEECNASIDQFVPLLRGGQGGTRQAVAFTQKTRDEVRKINGDGKIAGALAAETGMKQQTYVAVEEPAKAFTASEMANSYAWESDVYPTLNAQIPNDTSNIQYGVRQSMQVRRLTQIECERLQGFPDNYTRIPWKGKPAEECPDGHRYKALGNSMAVPVMEWIGERINLIEEQING
jgi:DNA (cytosine-5)-methyltransferase 1